MNRIRTIGYEIEGGWVLRSHLDKILDSIRSCNIVRDSSICLDRHLGEELIPREITSGIYKNNKSGLKKIKKDIKIVCKDILYNDTCGFHIHFGMETMRDYYRIANHNFVDKYIKLWDSDDRIQKRIRNSGSSGFCFYDKDYKNSSLFGGQMRADSGRYRPVNACYSKHKTIEFRLFPMADFNQLYNYLTETIDFINKFKGTTSCQIKDIEYEEESLNEVQICVL